MYTGTMIEDLISSVQKAEAHATEPFETEALHGEVPRPYGYEFTYQEALLGVA